MTLARRWLVLAALAASGCMQVGSMTCENGSVCPAGLRCGMAGEQALCIAPTCGNGRLDPGEACDDGGNVSGDGCPADCRPACGDGMRDPGELCDDGNTTGGDRCAADCRSAARCGDGDRDPGEACDDGNLDNQDGCSSRCSIEVADWTAIDAVPDANDSVMAYDAARGTIVLFGAPSNTWEWDGIAWQRRAPVTVPTLSAATATMVYDAARQRIAMFGTFDSPFGNAWEWDGSNWTARMATATPPLIQDYGIAYDTARHRVVLFGGRDYNGFYDQTWEWDGATWHEIATPARPSPRGAFGITYDSVRGTVVLYGGANATDFLYDTWEYDGVRWTRRATSGPPRSFYTRMVYDADRGKVVLFGGSGDEVDPAIASTWEWDGAAWTEVTDGEPPPRLAPAMTYDIVRRQVVLFGGPLRTDLFTPRLNDTWTRSGAGWLERRGDAMGPARRSHHAMVYEAGRTASVLFGGRDGAGACLGDTWLWSGTSWSQPVVDGAPAPAPRAEHAMAHDADRARTVLFGGIDAAGRTLDDTWTWDGAAWRAQPTAAHPPARRGHAMVYDAARARVLLIGGAAQDLRSDQWAWDGARWTELLPGVRPPPRTAAAAAYDPARDRVVLFGGLGAAGALRDVWEWDGAQWIDRTPATAAGPAARSGHALVADPVLRRIVLFGGHSDTASLGDAWTWDGARWARLSPSTMPRPRQHHAMVSDAARGRLVMFGGRDIASALGDLWFLTSRDPAVPREGCSTGFDGDGDGLAACADPDCRPLCASCGDGACSAFESCGLCPADCGACLVCGDLQCDPGETCARCPGDCGCDANAGRDPGAPR